MSDPRSGTWQGASVRSEIRTTSTGIEGAAWPLAAAQALDEHHLVAWSDMPGQRELFAADLSALLLKIDDTQVCEIDGPRVSDLTTFCDQLARGLGVESVAPRFDSRGGVCEALRSYPTDGAEPPVKRRYILWRDAHRMLRADPVLFGQMVDALVGVAAEGEFVRDDRLLLQRTVFLGDASLDLYSEDPRGQMRSWFGESSGDSGWGLATGERSPRVLSWRIGTDFVPA